MVSNSKRVALLFLRVLVNGTTSNTFCQRICGDEVNMVPYFPIATGYCYCWWCCCVWCFWYCWCWCCHWCYWCWCSCDIFVGGDGCIVGVCCVAIVGVGISTIPVFGADGVYSTSFIVAGVGLYLRNI